MYVPNLKFLSTAIMKIRKVVQNVENGWFAAVMGYGVTQGYCTASEMFCSVL